MSNGTQTVIPLPSFTKGTIPHHGAMEPPGHCVLHPLWTLILPAVRHILLLEMMTSIMSTTLTFLRFGGPTLTSSMYFLPCRFELHIEICSKSRV